MNPDWRNRYEEAVRAARDAGMIGMKYFPDAHSADFASQVEQKSDSSPVTRADREAEALLRERLLGTFPDDGFLGEEFGASPGSSGFRWIIDPIDGTRNFVRGIPIWGTLVGLEYRGEAIAGAIFIPPLGQLFHALRGNGAFRDEQRIRVSTIDQLHKAQVFYSSIQWFQKAGCQDVFLELANYVERMRGFGDVYGHVLVAQGSGELMVEHGVHIWDVAAVKPIIEEAGGRYSTWDGSPAIDRPNVLVSNGLLHEAALRILRQAGSSEKPA
ncbi:MAG: putative monophosphatase [Gemmatales bacterium]|nr:MAG: putative monophosphatase [Gemmatales bacterium]